MLSDKKPTPERLLGIGLYHPSWLGKIFLLILFVVLTNPHQHISHTLLNKIESISVAVYVGIGLFGLLYAGGFLDNRILGLGTFGDLFSAGAIPVIYICIGMKVGSELSNVLKNLQEA